MGGSGIYDGVRLPTKRKPAAGAGPLGRTGTTQPRPTGTAGPFPRTTPSLSDPDEEIK
jgi:hypothetical protein